MSKRLWRAPRSRPQRAQGHIRSILSSMSHDKLGIPSEIVHGAFSRLKKGEYGLKCFCSKSNGVLGTLGHPECINYICPLLSASNSSKYLGVVLVRHRLQSLHITGSQQSPISQLMQMQMGEQCLSLHNSAHSAMNCFLENL